MRRSLSLYCSLLFFAFRAESLAPLVRQALTGPTIYTSTQLPPRFPFFSANPRHRPSPSKRQEINAWTWTSHRAYNYDWDGDDLRWISRVRRRWKRSWNNGTRQPVQTSLLLINCLLYLYQTINTVQFIARRYPEYWPQQALSISVDAMLGSTVIGPLTGDFLYSTSLGQRQPHRLLTSGFLHGGLLHLLLNIDSLRRIPSWVETGLGPGLYLTTFLISIVTGNLGHSYLWLDSVPSSPCLGASGGICGLYGLMYAALVKMGNDQAASRLIRGIGFVFVYGLFVTNISTAAHVGGFLGGLAVGLLCGPSYRKDYAARRKWSLEVDVASRDYRIAMGFGSKPSQRGLLPLPLLWLMCFGAVLITPNLRSVPSMIVQGLSRPGTLSLR